MIRTLFINPQENRLRAGWRLLLHLVFYFGGLIAGAALLALAVEFFLAFANSDLTLMQVLTEAVNHPLGRVFGGLVSLGWMLLSYLIFARWIDHRALDDYGFHFKRRWWSDLGFGLLLGAFLMVVIFAVEWVAGWITITGFFQSDYPGVPFVAAVLSDLVFFICVGIYEEMQSRGYQIKNLAEGLNLKILGARIALVLAYLATSSFFGWLHAANPNASLTSTLAIMAAGLFLGLGYILTGELAIPIGLHITWNFFEGSVFGFPVSGTSTAATFIVIQQKGPEAWTGGAFGPEAGWLGLLAMGLGCVGVILWTRQQDGKAKLEDKIARYNRRGGE